MTPAEEKSGLENVSLQVGENGIESGGGSKMGGCANTDTPWYDCIGRLTP